ncbi:fused uroporphyrinogen-III synthase HemD/membrane protein HemX [Chitinimonas lacunae]|uniref:Fused uroporphyrinogen-III synthase HemD/membrane protein HemX n=1 Tax=Chitinimonas lacunae TaxID=1963018 RepID=A0ABV8MT95_9NEIS
MTARPLADRRILVTRPAQQADRLAALLREAGAQPLLAPMITIADTSKPETLDEVLRRLDDYDLAVFVSPSALDRVMARRPAWPARLPAAVVGPTSAERARELGIDEVIVPSTSYDSEGLLAEPALAEMHGQRVVLFRGNGGRELLADTLAERGASVDIVEAYRRLPPTLSQAELRHLLEAGCDAVTVSSSEALDNLFNLAGEELAPLLRQQCFLVSHPRIGETARRHGVTRVLPTAAGDAGLVATLIEILGHNGSSIDSRSPASAPAAEFQAHPDEPQAARAPQRIPSLSGDEPAAEPATRAVRPGRSVGGRRMLAWTALTSLLAVTSAVAISEWRLDQLRRELTQQHQAQQTAAAERAQRDADHLRQLEGRINQVEQRGGETGARIAALENLYGSLAGDRDATLLSDAEQTLSLAAQQLQLTGNVGAALTALYRLDERLAGIDQPQFAALRRALARDIEQLRRLPYVDLVGLATKLDTLAASVDRWPLVVDARATEQAGSEPSQGGNWFTRLMREVGAALGAFVEIRRVDHPDPVLLAPEQSLYLREHVKLRLLNARLALLQRDEPTYRQDLAAAEAVMRQRFDTQAKPMQAALKTLQELKAAPASLELPSLAESVTAARDARLKSDRGEMP